MRYSTSNSQTQRMDTSAPNHPSNTPSSHTPPSGSKPHASDTTSAIHGNTPTQSASTDAQDAHGTPSDATQPRSRPKRPRRDHMRAQAEQSVEAWRERTEALREQVERLRKQLAFSPPSPKALVLASLATGLLLGCIVAYALLAAQFVYERDAAVAAEKIRLQAHIDTQDARIYELQEQIAQGTLTYQTNTIPNIHVSESLLSTEPEPRYTYTFTLHDTNVTDTYTTARPQQISFSEHTDSYMYVLLLPDAVILSFDRDGRVDLTQLSRPIHALEENAQ